MKKSIIFLSFDGWPVWAQVRSWPGVAGPGRNGLTFPPSAPRYKSLGLVMRPVTALAAVTAGLAR